jgi:hypothetical protein
VKELERGSLRKEGVVAHCKSMSHAAGGTEVNHEESQPGQLSRGPHEYEVDLVTT